MNMKVGILGGGQLSKLLAIAGIPMGIECVFYFPEKSHTLHHLGKVIHAPYEAWEALDAFAQQVDVITYENENIPIQTIEYLEKLAPVFPGKQSICVAQDRLLEKNFFLNNDIPTNKFIAINHKKDIELARRILGDQLILKKRTQGYDGKGQIKIDQNVSLADIPAYYLQHTIAEEYVSFDREVSLILARNKHGCVHYDLCENIHENGVLRRTRNIKNDLLLDLAYEHVNKIARALDHVGILTVEFFQVGETLIANEIAPRVHNSGHWTIDACVTSQFANHLRAILGLPLGSAKSLTNAVMFNILSNMPKVETCFVWDELCFYDYEKTPAAGRKLGHITLVDDGNMLFDEHVKKASFLVNGLA